MSGSICDVCGERPSLGVGAMPGVPISFAYCKDCLRANAHPYAIVVANTAMLGGMDGAAPWWVQLVEDTLAHLGKTRAEFDASVLAEQQEFEAAEARANEEFARTEEGQPCVILVIDEYPDIIGGGS
jgi:hypothetical protein